MGASRKLQGEIDRVLKKVQEGVDIFDSIWNKVYDTDNANQKEKFEADLKKEIKKLQRYRDQIKTWIQSSEIKDKKVGTSYEQALMDARKIIEKEMERFKICEKETKTKAFSKEGLGQQPKTDPKEKAKSETRDWLNNVVGELECQIDNFEAELEGLSVRKGKTKPPRLAHLETSITRHKAHIMKLELILRLLDNDELSTEQVNDVKDFLEDYVERNQEDFEEFSDIDELYNSLSLDNVESLEDLVAFGPPGILKVSSTCTPPHSTSVEDHVQASNSSDCNLDIVPKTPPSKGAAFTASASSTTLPGILETPIPLNTSTDNSSTTIGTPVSGPMTLKIPFEMTVCTAGSPSNTIPSLTKDEETSSQSVPKTPQTPADHGNTKGVGRAGQTSQTSSTFTVVSAAANVTVVSVPSPITDEPKKNTLGCEDRLGNSGIVQQLASPYAGSSQLMQPTLNTTEGGSSVEALSSSDSLIIGGREFSPPLASNLQWRPESGFQNKNELFGTRTEIAPDQREKFLQRFQQIQQQGHTSLPGISAFSAANSIPFSPQKQSPILQQFNSQTGHVSPAHSGLGFGVSTSASVNVTTISSTVTKEQQPVVIMTSNPQQGTPSATQKDNDVAAAKYDGERPPTSSHDSNSGSLSVSYPGMTNRNDEDMKPSYVMDLHKTGPSPPLNDVIQTTSGDSTDPPITRLLQQTPLSSGNLGAISRRSISDIGAVGESLAGTSVLSAHAITHDQSYNLQMLDTAFCKLPLPKDSERVKNYVPRHPAVTPPSYPQTPAPIVNNPAFWARLGLDIWGTDTLFYAFYHQQNSYQQYLAAKELKKQSWRFHKKYNTWFQRHEEPKVATDEFEQGTYVYFDFHISNDDPQSGWCQRIKPDFTFEYNHLEDELML